MKCKKIERGTKGKRREMQCRVVEMRDEGKKQDKGGKVEAKETEAGSVEQEGERVLERKKRKRMCWH